MTKSVSDPRSSQWKLGCDSSKRPSPPKCRPDFSSSLYQRPHLKMKGNGVKSNSVRFKYNGTETCLGFGVGEIGQKRAAEAVHRIVNYFLRLILLV